MSRTQYNTVLGCRSTNRSTEVLSRSAVALIRSTEVPNKSVVALIRSTEVLNKSVIALIRSTEVLNRSVVALIRSTEVLKKSVVAVDPTRSTGRRDSLLDERKMWVDFRILENPSSRRTVFL